MNESVEKTGKRENKHRAVTPSAGQRQSLWQQKAVEFWGGQ